MPRQVTGGSVLRTLDVPERQILIAMEGEAESHWHHVLMTRIDGSRWVTVDPNLDVIVEDLGGEQVIPVTRMSAFPLPGRPFLTFDPMDDVTWAGVRMRAAALCEVHGIQAAVAATTGGMAVWVYSDPSTAHFGQEVPSPLVSDPATAKVGGSCGIVLAEPVSGAAAEWTAIERGEKADLVKRAGEKRTGPGRDRRLSSRSLAPSAGAIPLFRSSMQECGKPQVPNPVVYTGPAAVTEVIAGIVKSGLEPQGFVAQFVLSSGINARSALCLEFGFLVHSLYLMVCVDGLDPYRTTTAEHVARRILQIQKAVRRSPKTPDFEGLSEYMKHVADPSGGVDAPSFDKHVAEVSKTEAVVLKQLRLQREETEAEGKRRRGKNGKEKVEGEAQ